MSSPGGRKTSRLVEWLAAIVGGITCVLIPALFAQPGRRDFPFPGLYLIEIILCGVLVIGFVSLRSRLSPAWRAVPWAAAGIIFTFVILGGFSIGPYLIPAWIAFMIVGFVADRQTGGMEAAHLGVMLVAAVIQGAMMGLFIQVSRTDG